jgi:hypothetical protein
MTAEIGSVPLLVEHGYRVEVQKQDPFGVSFEFRE